MIGLKSESLLNFSHHNIWGDEMVSIIERGNSEWATSTIVQSMPLFDADFIWIYRPELTLIYSKSNHQVSPLNMLPFDRETLEQIIKYDKLHHFFITHKNRLIEISGTPIQSSTEQKSTSTTMGYFFAGRVWSDEYTGLIGSYTDSKINITISPAVETKTDPAEKNRFNIKNQKVLYGWDNEPIAVVASVFDYNIARVMAHGKNPVFIFFGFIVAIFSVALVVFLMLKVYRPLRLIFESIKSGNAAAIKGMMKSKNEFGKLSALINDSYIQKQQLNEQTIERKQIERQLVLLSKAINQSPDSILITNTKGEITFCNPAVIKVSGYSKEELIGKNPRLFGSGTKTKEEYQIIWDTITSGRVWEGEFQNKKKNGELFWETSTISPVFDSMGTITHYLAIRKDITEQKALTQELLKAKERAEESDRLKSAFLSNMSHEIRTPMNSIMGFASLMPDEESKEMMSEYAKIIYQNSEQLVNIIDGIVLYSKLQVHQLSYNPITFDLNKLLGEIENSFKLINYLPHINLIIDIDLQQSTIVKTDYEKLKQVLFNLITNAYKYTLQGEIRTGYTFDNDEYKFHVSDTGIGIPPKDNPAIFERFYRGSNINESTMHGTGIGLSIVKELVALMGGTIWAENNVGSGSTFYFTLPIKS
jgi:PAS domain S-box-containing protein